MPDIIIPPKMKPKDNTGYFEILTKAVFQAGFSWIIVERKWNGFREIFLGFDSFKIATWGEDEILHALESPLIIRNSRKITAMIENAKKFNDIIKEYSSFEAFLGSFRDESYKYRSKFLSDQFKWMGKTGAFFFLYSTGENVPEWQNR